MNKGLYIHIPFCKRRCAYCDFYSTTEGDLVRSSFVNALCRELRQRRDYAGTARLSTIYFGGGTPSQLSGDELSRIFRCIWENYTIEEGAEVTMEVNPDDIVPPAGGVADYATDTAPKCDVGLLKDLGINRISMGVQSFHDHHLLAINRRHTAAQARKAVSAIRKAGMENISLDLIYALPGQTLKEWESDVEDVLRLRPRHISAYALSYEEGTPLYDRLLRGEIEEADDELSLTMYRHLIERLENAGFEHYEISNFALPAFRSCHNSSYWTGAAYQGVGPGAHSFDGKSLRRANLPDLHHYISALDCDLPSGSSLPVECADAPHELEQLSSADLYNEFVMLSLRTKDGICLKQFEEIFGKAHLQNLQVSARPFLDDKKMEHVDGRLRLTRSGIFLSDAIIRELLILAS